MQKTSPLSWAGYLILTLVVSVGSVWSFERGAPDFSVFFAAWKVILSGPALEVYHSTPDRFLYAPGFAWILAPLGLLSREVALALWCMGKVFALAWMIREITHSLGGLKVQFPMHSWGISALGVAILARPLLIDFQYGQVNTYILAFSSIALFRHLRSDSQGNSRDFILWSVAGIVAGWKLFTLPLVLVPLLNSRGVQRKKCFLEFWGFAAGFLLTLIIPAVSVGMSGAIHLLLEWKTALFDRGFPLESHNQSFMAFLYHYFSGQETPYIAMSSKVLHGWSLLSEGTIHSLGLAWTFSMIGIILGWIVSGDTARDRAVWTAVLIGLLVLPSHLIWKPYFITGIPVAIIAVHRVSGMGVWLLGALFVLINFTGFDMIGYAAAAKLEAASLFLFTHLALIGLAVGAGPKNP